MIATQFNHIAQHLYSNFCNVKDCYEITTFKTLIRSIECYLPVCVDSISFHIVSATTLLALILYLLKI